LHCSDNSPFKVDIVCDEVMTDMDSNDKNVFEKNRLQIKGNSDINIRMYSTKMVPVVGLTQTDDTYYFQVSVGHSPNCMGLLKPIKLKDADPQLQEMLKSYDTMDSDADSAGPNLKNYVFVVDGSGSMTGNCIDNAAKALKIAIKQLPTGSKYMIYIFGDNGAWSGSKLNKFYPVQKPMPKTSSEEIHQGVSCDDCHSYPINGKRYNKTGYDFDLCDSCYTSQSDSSRSGFEVISGKVATNDTTETVWVTHSDETFKETVKWIDENVNANYGGTRLAVAVSDVMKRLSASDSNVIVMLTDAGVGDDEVADIVKSLETSIIKPEVFCMGLGGGVTMSLLESMSNYGRGISIGVNDFNTIKEKCLILMNCAVNSKFLRNITFNVPPHMEVSTRKPITAYFMGEPLNIFVKVARKDFTGNEKLTIESSSTPFMELGFDHASESSINLEMVYHMTLLESMEKNPELYYSYDKNKGLMTKEEYNKCMVEMGCKYNIVTSRTSAVFVRELENADGTKKMEKIDVPISINTDKVGKAPSEPAFAYFCSFGAAGFDECRYDEESDDEDMDGFSLFDSGSKSNSQPRGRIDKTLGIKFENQNEMRSDPVEHSPVVKSSSVFNKFVNVASNMVSSLTNTSTKEKTVVNKYDTMNTEELIDEMVLCQNSNGAWSYDVLFLNCITTASDVEYHQVIPNFNKLDKNDFMTLMVMAFFQSKTEFYTTYAPSLRKATSYMTSKVDGLKSVLLALIQVGYSK
jgi:hypothetical protein